MADPARTPARGMARESFAGHDANAVAARPDRPERRGVEARVPKPNEQHPYRQDLADASHRLIRERSQR
ncbi:MAG TPA: hypothetical protein PLJ27_10740 [Polyangiaceae bacterium]|nr:hypothetical protein [Polyangiaceae bacterium]HOE47077.1 hypothetical protein [Polyangiaceae bacterium]HOR33536.1 hypothetical protein [Polyangiaceae bacterium]HOT11078.1 hypothetical protein [Polyangiaceae bacterium]HPB99143.1 hypothetical protein [Polyangiaceae bacterium]